MSEHTGFFKVVSQWNSEITGTAQHRTTDYGTTTINFTLTQSGDSSAVSAPFTTSTTNKDRWSISFKDGSGRLYAATHNCGFESEDNGKIVQLVVNQADMEFKQVMPVSSGCDTSIDG